MIQIIKIILPLSLIVILSCQNDSKTFENKVNTEDCGIIQYVDTLNGVSFGKKFCISYELPKNLIRQMDISGRVFSRTFGDEKNSIWISITDYDPNLSNSYVVKKEREEMELFYPKHKFIYQQVKTFQNNFNGVITLYDCDTIYCHVFNGINQKYNVPFYILTKCKNKNKILIDVIKSIKFEEIII